MICLTLLCEETIKEDIFKLRGVHIFGYHFVNKVMFVYFEHHNCNSCKWFLQLFLRNDFNMQNVARPLCGIWKCVTRWIQMLHYLFCDMSTGQMCLVLQYVSRGDMLRILRRCRSRRRDQGPVEPLPPHELLSFGMDVAKGMRHLSTYKVK